MMSGAHSVETVIIAQLIISCGAGTMYTPCFGLARSFFAKEGRAATALGVMIASKAAGTGLASLSIIICESIGWRNTYVLMACLLAISIVLLCVLSVTTGSLSSLDPNAATIPTNTAADTSDVVTTTTDGTTMAGSSSGTGKRRTVMSVLASLPSQVTWFILLLLVVSQEVLGHVPGQR